MMPTPLHRGTSRASVLWGFVIALVVLAGVATLALASPGVGAALLLIGTILGLIVVVCWIFMAGR